MTCHVCLAENQADARFCKNCGAPIGAPRSSGTLSGERKVVTILFADVVGSTSMAEQVDPEDWADIMNGATGFMNAAVTRYEGTVGRLMGDAILALFGAPTAHEDDAERAVRAGLDIVASARAYAKELKKLGLGFDVRVGINTGLSVLTTVGDATKAEYTAMGDPANVASRLQGLATPGTVLIGPDTHALVRRAFQIRPRGVETIKGRQEPLETFEVMGVRSGVVPSPWVDDVTSVLVGRDVELAQLRKRVEAVIDGTGAIITLVGEAGLGKSRLVDELKTTREGARLRWLSGRSLSYTRSAPYQPWKEILLASIAADDAEPPESVRAKLASRASLDGSSVALIEALLGIESADAAASVANVEGQDIAARIADAVVAHLVTLSREQPLAVVLEDVHWADAASIDLLVAVAERSTGVPLMLLAAMRPDGKAPNHDLPARAAEAVPSTAWTLRLEPLGEQEARRLMTAAADVRGLPDAIRDQILSRAEGNPFYLEEILRSLIESGYVVKEGEGWRATRGIGNVPIPDTLDALLGARLDGLPAAAKQVAQTASVIGRSFRGRLLGSVVRDDPRTEAGFDVSPQLDVLARDDLLVQVSPEPEIAFAFKHALTQEAAYERLLVRRRRELHLVVGRVLERGQRDRHEDIAAILAHHFRLAEAWPSAAAYAAVAAAQARHLYALPEALAHYEDALDALDHEPPEETGPEDERAFIDTVLGWVDVVVATRAQEHPENRQRIHERLDHAIERARSLNDERRLVQVLVAKGNVFALSGLPDSGFPYFSEAYEVARRLGDDRSVLLPFWAATEGLTNDDPAAAAAQFEQVIELARRVHNPGIEAHALGSRAVALARLGRFQMALEAVRQALDVVDRSGSTVKEADVLMLAGATFMDVGWLELALQYAGEGTELALSVNGFECASRGLYLQGMGQMAASDTGSAVDDFERAMLVAAGTAYEPWLYNVRAARAAARAQAGGADGDAVQEIERELEHAVTLNDGFGAAGAKLGLALALLPSGRFDEAEAYTLDAADWYRERGMKPYVERSLRALVAVYEAKGAAREAARAVRESDEIHASLAFDPDVARAAWERFKAARTRPPANQDAAAPSAVMGA